MIRKRWRVDVTVYSAPALGGLAFAEGERYPGGRLYRSRRHAELDARDLQEFYNAASRSEKAPVRVEVVDIFQERESRR